MNIKRYFESETEFTGIIEQKDKLIIFRGDIGGTASSKERPLSTMTGEAELISNMLINVWEQEGFIEKPIPETDIKIVNKTLEDYADEALLNKDSITVFIEKIVSEKATKQIFLLIDRIINKWGVIDETAGLLAAASLMPGSQKQLDTLCEKYNVSSCLKNNTELSEKLFYEIQSVINDVHLDDYNTSCPTKAYVKKIGKKIAIVLNMFGYVIHAEGLKTVMRTFDNESVEGISVQMYNDNIKYNSEDYGYYDGIENQNDDFWAGIDMLEMIK